MRKTLFAFVLVALTLLSGCHEHTWSEATCLAPATCIECEKVKDETLADHVWQEATCVTPKTCSVCAMTEGEPLSHTWIEANCGAPKTCATCNTTEGKPVGEHNWIEATCDAPKTCTVCSETEGKKLRHFTSVATCTEPRTCKYCGVTIGEAMGHMFVEATCYAAPTCRRCGFAEGTPLPHNFVDGVCTACGYYVRPSVHPNAAYAAYFGINPNIQWVENPKTRDELINNILWNALNGDFDFNYVGKTVFRDSKDAIEIIDSTITAYNSILGAYTNVMRGGRIGSNFWIHYDANPLPLTNEDVFNQALVAIEKAQSISKKLHDNGTITADMSQKQIVEVYYNYLQKYGNQAKGGPELQGTGKNMYYDSAYSCLVDKNAACGGRAAAFNLLMHVEGISAQGISGQIYGTETGHVISRVVADGREYFVDWGNYNPIGNYEETCKWFNFNFNNSMTVLEIARKAGQILFINKTLPQY